MKYCKKCGFTYPKEEEICPIHNAPLDDVPREELFATEQTREDWSKEGLKNILKGNTNDRKR